MQAVMQSKELAFEAGRLLLSTRAQTQKLDMERLSNLRGKLESSDEAAVMEKSIVKVIKAALLRHGTGDEMYFPCIRELDRRLRFVGVTYDFERPIVGDATPLDRAEPLSWLHLLAAVPFLMANADVDTGRPNMYLIFAAQTASIALALMEHGSTRWEPLLASSDILRYCLHGLSLWDYELVVRMLQSHFISMMASRIRASYSKWLPIMAANVEHILSVQPTNKWNLLYCNVLVIGGGKRYQEMRNALKVADDNGDDYMSICLRWILCHEILLGAEGPSFPVASVLSVVKKARAAMDQAESWTNPKAMLPP
ncbi:hypothetical protein COCOBI_15-1350 [Coccomyxa sp. Obi]|nr:hypothetical protein COCOBI_15-1350 [Coccomyxa sp. Obi]